MAPSPKPVNKKKKKLIIGRTDKADFPDFDLHDVDIKIDTGAYSSVIHGTQIKTIERKGKKILSFYVYGSGQGGNKRKKYYFEQFSRKNIKSSNGQSELRYMIKTSIILFGKKFKTDFSITNRMKMKYPILVGRKLLKGRFIVDVAQTLCSYKLNTRTG